MASNDGIETFEGTMNTQQDGFNGNLLPMPARSVIVNDPERGMYMNIPRQNILVEGTPNHLYRLTGITFSANPLYSNS